MRTRYTEPEELYLVCQCCGEKMRPLTPDESKRIIENPYNFIVYCQDPDCQEQRRHEFESYYLDL